MRDNCNPFRLGRINRLITFVRLLKKYLSVSISRQGVRDRFQMLAMEVAYQRAVIASTLCPTQPILLVLDHGFILAY